jgi:hypothetical protein
LDRHSSAGWLGGKNVGAAVAGAADQLHVMMPVRAQELGDVVLEPGA